MKLIIPLGRLPLLVRGVIGRWLPKPQWKRVGQWFETVGMLEKHRTKETHLRDRVYIGIVPAF